MLVLTFSSFVAKQEALDQVEAENREKALLGTGKPYQRTIP